MQPSTITERMQELMLAQWHELQRLRIAVLETSDSEAIHDLRVASRRFRATLKLFGPWLPSKGTARLTKSCRKLTRQLGTVRNIDEALLFFPSHTAEKSGDGHMLCSLLMALRPAERARVDTLLMNIDQHRLDRIVQKSILRLNERMTAATLHTLPSSFSDTSLRLFKPIATLIPVATSPEQREARHALRIAIKKLRYFFEIVAIVQERDHRSIIGQLKEYQNLLGRMNDIAEFAALCGKLSLPGHEYNFVTTTLHGEDERLLQELTILIAQKPLSHTPLF